MSMSYFIIVVLHRQYSLQYDPIPFFVGPSMVNDSVHAIPMLIFTFNSLDDSLLVINGPTKGNTTKKNQHGTQF